MEITSKAAKKLQKGKKSRPAGRPTHLRAQRKRVAGGSEEIPTIAQFSPKGGNGAMVGISELVRQKGLEPPTY